MASAKSRSLFAVLIAAVAVFAAGTASVGYQSAAAVTADGGFGGFGGGGGGGGGASGGW